MSDKQLTIRQALRKYKKGVFWAMILSTALIMEGYDIVIVSRRAFLRLMPDFFFLWSRAIPTQIWRAGSRWEILHLISMAAGCFQFVSRWSIDWPSN